MTPLDPLQHWVIFCRVVDNYGDVGVCWRLSEQLAQRGKQVTLYLDDPRPLQWMAPKGCAGVTVFTWPDDSISPTDFPFAYVVIEAFGCDLPPGYQAAMASWTNRPTWINLEYFSAESVAERNHGLPSPVMSGPAKGLTKWFFYPGLTRNSGGLLGPGSEGLGTPDLTVSPPHDLLSRPLCISVFCYEPASLGLWLEQLDQLPATVRLCLTAGRATQAVTLALQHMAPTPHLQLEPLPFLSQIEYDQLLCEQDLNLVRGEDSLVRAIWAGKPFLWQIYPQEDGAHWPKLQAFLQATKAPSVVAQAHLAWNANQPTLLPMFTAQTLRVWGDWARRLRQDLLAQTDLIARLESFVSTHG